MLEDTVFVTRPGVWPQGGLLVELIPEADPIPEAHVRAALLWQLSAVSCLVLPQGLQLFQTFRFRFGQNAFGFGIALFIISDEEPPFPASVASVNHSAFAVLSPFAHGSTSSMKLPTIFAALCCMSLVTWV